MNGLNTCEILSATFISPFSPSLSFSQFLFNLSLRDLEAPGRDSVYNQETLGLEPV